MMKKKIGAILLSAGIALSAAAGCSGKKEAVPAPSPQPAGKETSSALPIVKNPITIRWFQPNYNTGAVKSYTEIEAYKEVSRRTGIAIEWMHPASNDQLNLILASGDYPDVMFGSLGGVKGGYEKLVNDKIALRLNELIDKNAPDFKKLLESTPELKKQMMLSDGTIPYFPQIQMDRSVNYSNGFAFRSDWVENLNMKMPETIDQWYETLKAFRDKDPNGNGKADEIPFVSEKGGDFINLAPAWGVKNGMYRDTDKIKFGPIEPGWRDFTSTMARWYKEKLIDNEYVSADRKVIDAKMMGDIGGALFARISSQIGTYNQTVKVQNARYNLTGVKFPIGPAGKPYYFSDSILNYVGDGAIITSACKYPDEVTKLLNYLYSEEGSLLMNYGIEGKSYTKVDGKPKYLDSIINDKDRINAVSKFCLPVTGSPRLAQGDAILQISFGSQVQLDTLKAWGASDNSILVPRISRTAEENTRYAQIMGDVDSYVKDSFVKFVLGVESLDKFDDYVATIKKMGIDDAVKLTQDAYARFKAVQ